MTVHSTPITSSGLFWRRHRSTALLLATALPAVIFLLVFYITPMALLFAESFEGGTFKHFEKALTDGLYVGVLVDTLVIAACVSVVCLLLGYPVAYFLASTRAPWPTIGIIFVLLPFWTSILVRTYGWMILLGRNGIVNRALIELGLIAHAAAAAQQHKRRADRHGPCPAAIHGVSDLRRHAPDRPCPPRRGRRAWGAGLADLPPDLLPADAARASSPA